MFVHDFADHWLELGKLLKYAKFQVKFLRKIMAGFSKNVHCTFACLFFFRIYKISWQFKGTTQLRFKTAFCKSFQETFIQRYNSVTLIKASQYQALFINLKCTPIKPKKIGLWEKIFFLIYVYCFRKCVMQFLQYSAVSGSLREQVNPLD